MSPSLTELFKITDPKNYDPRALWSTNWAKSRGIPIATVDDETISLYAEAQPGARLDTGHIFICGREGRGKTELLNTVVLELALTYGPEDAEFTLIGDLDPAFNQLPHTGSMGSFDEVSNALSATLMKRQLIQECEGDAVLSMPKRFVVVHPLTEGLWSLETLKMLRALMYIGPSHGIYVITAQSDIYEATQDFREYLDENFTHAIELQEPSQMVFRRGGEGLDGLYSVISSHEDRAALITAMSKHPK